MTAAPDLDAVARAVREAEAKLRALGYPALANKAGGVASAVEVAHQQRRRLEVEES